MPLLLLIISIVSPDYDLIILRSARYSSSGIARGCLLGPALGTDLPRIGTCSPLYITIRQRPYILIGCGRGSAVRGRTRLKEKVVDYHLGLIHVYWRLTASSTLSACRWNVIIRLVE
jgi:hypothetical protein